ncbi:PR domain zinc finger protein 5 [Culex quinquefasciatus]|uniref:PR domain zinc finger protein 5 n=1 Tax=Culex quinquefasciatus TaxID=7176 RepID=UPI0018E3E317|nr:PR domain zinc finger protein 5 [Culex quinquefasciatus]
MNTSVYTTCRLCSQPCEFNNRLNDRNLREKAQDILVLYLKVDEKNISIVCDSCQSQVESFYHFKWTCRQNEKNRGIPKAASGPARVVDALSIITQKESKPKPIQTVKVKKPIINNRYYKRRTDRVYKRITKEQLATKTRKELYKERARKVCELCGKSYHTSYMDEHMNKHRGVQPYPCDVLDCGAKFGGPWALKKHIDRVHSEGQHPCPLCNKMFRGPGAVRVHMRLHKEKTIFCEICNFGFHTQSRLQNHMLVHTQKRDHKCEYCEKAFYAKQVLELHRRSHMGERPYACHVCDFSHAHRILYVKHMQKLHPGEEVRTLAEIQRMAKVQRRNAHAKGSDCGEGNVAISEDALNKKV